MGLVDAKGNPLMSGATAKEMYAKAAPPQLGEKFGPTWGSDLQRGIMRLLGHSGLVQFDLTKLTLADFRVMRDHYQINACLSAMTFMLHQMDWKIECKNKKIKQHVEDNMSEIWTVMIRSMSQAHWAGFSPNILQWENDPSSHTIQLTKIKDLIPEFSLVNWKQVDGFAPPGHIPPKIDVYDGIRVFGQAWPVPVDNSMWYPLLAENGDMYGRKLLRSAFTSWYFSLLMHLYANRYFERFGEPVPIGRAPYTEEMSVNVDGTVKKVNGAVLMTQILQNLRNRSVVVLPNDRTAESNSLTGTGDIEYDYDIKYLESQMRGADFERILSRLDEEMSLSMFTPLLVLRTSDVGSYNLGSTHWTMYQNMLNALAGDMKLYIDKFIISRMVDFNFGKNAPKAKITFRKMGDDKQATITAILQALIPTGTVKVDLDQLGEIAGIGLSEQKVLTAPTDGTPPPVGGAPKPKATATGGGKQKKPVAKKPSKNSMAILDDVAARVQSQILKALSDGKDSDGVSIAMGYERRLSDSLETDGFEDAEELVRYTYRQAAAMISELTLRAFENLTPGNITAYLRSIIGSCLEIAAER